MLRFLLLFAMILMCRNVLAWEDHALITKVVLEDWSADNHSIAKYLNQKVRPESLKSFLTATRASLPLRLNEIEKWARNNEHGYQPLPEILFYQPSQTACSVDIENCFKQALRINLDVPLLPIVYDVSDFYARQTGFKRLNNIHQIIPAYISVNYQANNFTVIPVTGVVSIADLISTSSMQPDFGFDTFLYENSQTSFGKMYGFGTQPMGNPLLPYHSQMLFHMSTYHEDAKILAAVTRLNESYPEYRAYLFANLSRFAAEHDHPYWAAVFLGWALHYIQDMTQPYHTRMAYGLDANLVLQALMEAAKNNAKPLTAIETLQVNRHVILENLTNHILSSPAMANNVFKSTLYRGLKDKSIDNKIPPCDLRALYLRNQITIKMADVTPDYQSILQAAIPSAYVNDSDVHVELTMDYHHLFSREMTQSQRQRFSNAISQSLRLYAAYTRSCINGYMPVTLNGKN